MNRKPSQRQLEALELVAAGRVQYGAEYPARSRRAAQRGRSIAPTFLVDRLTPYGSGHATWSTVESRGWIVVRHDQVPNHRVAEQIRTYSTVTGAVNRTIPAHEEPIDPGWRAAVDLTDTGRQALERYLLSDARSRPRGSVA